MALFESIGGFISAFVEWAQDMWSKYGEQIMEVIKVAWDYISTIIKVAIQLITDIFNVFSALFRGDWEELWEAVKTLLSNYISGVFDIFKKYIDMISEYLSLIGDVISDIWSGIWDGIKTKFEEIWNGIKGFFVGIWDGLVGIVKNNVNNILKLINMMIGAINGFKINIPDWLTDLTGIKDFSFNIPKIPMLAKGGTVTGKGSFIAGEAGAELISMTDNGVKVTPLTNQQKKSVNGGENTIQNYFNIAKMEVRNEADIKKVARELFNLQKQNERGLGFV